MSTKETTYQRLMREAKEQFEKEIAEEKNMRLEVVLDKLLKEGNT